MPCHGAIFFTELGIYFFCIFFFPNIEDNFQVHSRRSRGQTMRERNSFGGAEGHCPIRSILNRRPFHSQTGSPLTPIYFLGERTKNKEFGHVIRHFIHRPFYSAAESLTITVLYSSFLFFFVSPLPLLRPEMAGQPATDPPPMP